MEEVPIEILAMSRVKHKKWMKGGKADVVVCSNFDSGFSKKIKCDECGEVCFYTEGENLDMKKENIKKICNKCCLSKYKEHMHPEQIALIELAMKVDEEEKYGENS